MTGILALVVRILSNPYSNVVQKKLSLRGFKPLWISFFSYFLLSIFVIFPAIFVDWSAFEPVFWKYVIISGFIGALGNWFLTEAIKYGELSVLGPINSYKSVVSIIFAFFILHEIPSLVGVFGIFLIVLGSYFVFDSVSGGFSFKIFLRKDIRYRIFALILTALEAVFIKKIIVMSDVLVSFILWCASSALFSFVLMLFAKNKIKEEFYLSTKRYPLYFLLLSFLMFLMQFSTNIVFEHINVSCALALFQLSSLVSVVLGWKYFKEKNILKKLFGALIMVFGAVVVILF